MRSQLDCWCDKKLQEFIPGPEPMPGQKVQKYLFPSERTGRDIAPLPGGHLMCVEATTIWREDPGQAKVSYLELA